MKMQRFAFIALAAVAVCPAFAVDLFYGGDFDGLNSLASEENTIVPQAMTYDNFTVGATGWTVNSLGGIFTVQGTFTTARYEIRQGMSAGNGGTLLQSGLFSVSSVDIGDAFGLDLRDYNGSSFAPFFLAAGNYHLGISLVSAVQGQGRAFVATTSGANGVGGPLNDYNSFFNSAFFGATFQPTNTTVNSQADHDFAYRIGGEFGTEAVPEPGTLALAGLGLAAYLRRRKKSL